MKKLLLLLTILFTSLTGWSQCDFSGITFRKVQQEASNMYFQTNMHSDDCWYYYFTVYDYQLDKVDTLEDWGGYTGVSFGKGKYQMRLNVGNECEKCDTVFTLEVDVTVFNKLGYTYDIGAKNCKYYTFELEDRKDTCSEYYYTIYKGDKWIDSLTDKEWKEVDDSTIYFTYSWADTLIQYYSIRSERVLDYTFKDSGRYFIIPMVYNRCTEIDTWAFKKLNVCLEFKTVSVKKITETDLQNVTVVGYYDLLGRHVDYMEPNKIYVVLYSDGRRLKVMRTQ